VDFLGGFLGGCTQKNPLGFFWGYVPGCLNPEPNLIVTLLQQHVLKLCSWVTFDAWGWQVVSVCNIAVQQNAADTGLQQQQQQQQYQRCQAISLVSYDVDARMRMFGWLNR